MERINALKEIYATIDFGTVEDKIRNIPEFPKIIEFELTNNCNYQCIMCPTGLKTAKRPRGYMNEDTFRKVVDEIAGRKIAVKFVGQGEPFMHPKAVAYMKQMKEAGAIVHITTNGSFLTDEIMSQMVEIGVDSVKFSFQGVTAEGYRTFRQKDAFSDYMECIKRFSEIRGNASVPFLTIGTSVVDESTVEIASFKDKCKDIVDCVEVGITSLEYVDFSHVRDVEKRKRLDDLKESQKQHYQRYQVCPQIFDTLAVRWNGDVTACCSDIDGEMTLGNLQEDTILECWNGTKENAYRQILKAGAYEKIPHCSKCYDIYGWSYGTN